MKLDFFVPGQPRGAGSKHGMPIKQNGQYTGRVRMIDSSGEKGILWTSSIVGVAFEAARAANWKPVDEPVILRAEFIFLRPKSHFRTGRLSNVMREDAPIVHCSTPDIDKLERRLCDALTGIVWTDDKLICEKHSYKRFGDQPGAHVTVTTYADEKTLRDGLEQAARVGKLASPSDLKSDASEFESQRG